jgi:hypothetical protein
MLLQILTIAMTAGSAAGLPGAVGYLAPRETTQFNTGTGSLICTANGLISRNPANAGRDTTTLSTFAFDDSFAGKQCQLYFRLGAGVLSGTSRKLQLFSSLNVSPACGTPGGSIPTWPPGNQRNQQIANVDIVPNGEGTIYPEFSAPFVVPTPCPAGQRIGFELGPTGDDITVRYNATMEGLFMIYW